LLIKDQYLFLVIVCEYIDFSFMGQSRIIDLIKGGYELLKS